MFPLKDENPTHRVAYVTIALIVINALVFIFPQGTNHPERSEETFILEWAAIPCEVTEGRPLTGDEITETFRNGGDQTACGFDNPSGPPANDGALFPNKMVWLSVVFSMFMHASWMHLGSNMLFLWIFGNNIEDKLGPVRYLIFYLLGGIAADLAHILPQPDSTIPVVGASGAVAAVMGAYAVWYPNAPIRTIIFIMLRDISAKWMLGIWFVMQFFTGAGSGVAWLAHVGGFVFGALVALFIRSSKPAQRALFTKPYKDVGQWDNTGGIGPGPYRRPQDTIKR